MSTGHNMFFLYHYSSVLGVIFVRLVNPPHVCTVSILLYAQYLMLCGFSYFEVFKFPNSAMRISNVGVSAHCMLSARLFNRNRNRKLQTSKAPLKSQAQGTSLFTSAASSQRGFQKNSPLEAQVRFPEGERMRQIRGVFQRIVHGRLRSGFQKVRGGRLGVKAGVV